MSELSVTFRNKNAALLTLKAISNALKASEGRAVEVDPIDKPEHLEELHLVADSIVDLSFGK